MVSYEAAQGAQPRALKLLGKRNFPEVTGVGIARRGADFVLKVNLRSAPSRALPADVDGVPIVSEIVGDVVAH